MRPSFDSRLGLSVLPLVILAFTGSTASASTVEDVVQLVDSNFLYEARQALEGLDEGELKSPQGMYAEARLEFFEGDHLAAIEGLRRAIAGARGELAWKQLRDQVELSKEAFAGLSSSEGAGGRFVFSYQKGDDALLVPYADRALTAQLSALEKIFGDSVKERIQVSLVPDVETLSKASGLTTEQIERTGTVGICKYGKVMVLTPRVLAVGYPWLDTLAHELTHYFITRASKDTAPIWLHEGAAKLYELKWRKDGLTELSPQEAYLLDRAAREGRLIPLRRFHPSVAHLPSQEDSALAYAQVLSFMRYVDDRLGGGDWLSRVLGLIGEGMDIDEAFTEVSRFPVRRLYIWWEQTVKGTRQTPVPAVYMMERRFKTGDVVGPEPPMEMEADVRRHARLGDLLRLRGHDEAAVKEYKEALALGNNIDPSITERLGGCLINLARHGEAVEVLLPMVELNPARPTGFVQLGRAYEALGKTEDAARMYDRAISLNPFNPEIHCAQARLKKAQGKDEDASLEESHCRMLRPEATIK